MAERVGTVEPLPEGLPEALARPDAYPSDASAAGGVRSLQTHLSYVFLTPERVYKIRKAVDLGFVDFSTRAARNADCLREVALNRRLAPDVYLGVAPIEAAGARLRVGPLGEALAPGAPLPEHCVVMRRLPDGGDALALLERGALRAAHVDAVARVLAAFHARVGLGVPAPWSPDAWLAHVAAPLRDTLASLEDAAGRLVPRRAWQRARAATEAFLEREHAAFEARRLEGRAVDGHGDVHLQHVWFEPGRVDPLLVDCVEFSDSLRRIDRASEVAFLAMDLAYRGRRALAERFLRAYAREADDYGLYGVVDYYVGYRAAVRAKVAAIAADDAGIRPAQREAAARSARRHLALAVRAVQPGGRGAIILVGGAVGTGKTTVAELLADVLGGTVIGSDPVRKQLAGLAATDRRGAAEGLYGEARKDAVYAALLERAAAVVASGRVALLDATYARARHREAVRRWAAARAAPLAFVETRCRPETARARLARRSARGGDASDAGPELHAPSLAAFEPVAPDVGGPHLIVHTDATGWRSRLRVRARALRAILRGEARADAPAEGG